MKVNVSLVVISEEEELLSAVREGSETACLISNRTPVVDLTCLHLNCAPQSMVTVGELRLLLGFWLVPLPRGQWSVCEGS